MQIRAKFKQSNNTVLISMQKDKFLLIANKSRRWKQPKTFQNSADYPVPQTNSTSTHQDSYITMQRILKLAKDMIVNNLKKWPPIQFYHEFK